MNVTYVGTGYVGIVSGAVTAKKGHDVYCVDLPEKVEYINNQLSKGKIHIYEPGLKEIVEETFASGKLHLTDSIEEAVKNSELIFITVGTPSNEDGSANLEAVYNVTNKIGKNLNSYKLVAVKSTVPPGTTREVKNILKRTSKFKFDVAMNPEFLREGRAVEDTERPDRIVIGVETKRAEELLREFYRPFTLNNNPILVMSPTDAEIVKYGANAHLATRISVSNELANLCDKIGADYTNVVKGIGTDKRIGRDFLYPGIGYGGSCFPKDLKAIIQTAKKYGIRLKIFEAVDEVNGLQKTVMYYKIKKLFGANISDKTFGIWGLSFKPKTDDIREAPAVSLIEKLLENKSKIQAYDPKAMSNIRKVFGEKIKCVKSPYEAINGADALVLCTEWDEFREPDFEKVKELLKTPVIFDGRNVYDSKKLKKLGIKHVGIGSGN